MAWRAIVIDESFTAEGTGGVVHVPEGYYLMEGVEVEPSPEDRDEDKFAFLLWHLKVVKGPAGSVGSRLKWGPCTMKEGAQFNNGRLINLVGIKAQADAIMGKKLPTYKAFQSLATGMTNVFKGKRVTALVADGEPWTSPKSGEKYPTSKIVSLFPAEEYDDLAASMADLPAAKKAEEKPARGRKDPVKEEPATAVVDDATPEDTDIDALFANIK